MTNHGWIKLHRQFLRWEWYDDINTKVLFMHLLLTVNYEDKRWKGITIKRGQIVTGRKTLAKQTQLTEQQVRTSLAKLKSTNEITIKTTNKFTIISICKYEEYQGLSTSQSTSNLTNKQPTNNQQITTTKEYNNTKNDKETKSGGASAPTPKQIAENFFSDVSLQDQTALSLSVSKNLDLQKVRGELDSFVDYWTELSSTGKKQRWEMQKTFEVQKRLATWFKRSKSFNKPQKGGITFIS